MQMASGNSGRKTPMSEPQLPTLASARIVLLDIEGTVCPISFVKEILFPYAQQALPELLADKWDDPEFVRYRQAFPREHNGSPKKFLAYFDYLTANDVKTAPYFKSLQGYLWEIGFRSGAIVTPLYSDVVPTLRKWKKAGPALAIYSSGSVDAQKLLFGHVRSPEDEAVREDLTGLFGFWFDTANAGSKIEAQSYNKIVDLINAKFYSLVGNERKVCSTKDILFLTDNVKELAAATSAGVMAVGVSRQGNAPVSQEDTQRYPWIESFDTFLTPLN